MNRMAVKKRGKDHAQASAGIIGADRRLGAPAAAQDTGQDTAGNGNTGIRDIIVTAQRKSESTQKAGIAIAVLSGEQLLQKACPAPMIWARRCPRSTCRRAVGR